MTERKVRVLIVDDDVDVLNLLSEILYAEGCEVVPASSGLEGVLKARENIDIAILDMMMPGIDGINVCNALKSDPETEHISVLFLTGYADETVLRSCEHSGDGVMRKPINCPEFIATVRELAGRFALV
jgi:CheY-like chemotaxis protein